jgi:hypothetical protein
MLEPKAPPEPKAKPQKQKLQAEEGIRSISAQNYIAVEASTRKFGVIDMGEAVGKFLRQYLPGRLNGAAKPESECRPGRMVGWLWNLRLRRKPADSDVESAANGWTLPLAPATARPQATSR